jgi:hypothetical protein
MDRRWWPVVGLVVWTAYVWITRIANAWGDAALSTGGKVASTLLSLSLLVPAAAVGVVAVRRRRARPSAAEVVVLRVFAGWTIAVWAVRVPMILAADHSVAFKGVHAALGLVSVVLALAVVHMAGRVAVERGDVAEPVLGGTC